MAVEKIVADKPAPQGELESDIMVSISCVTYNHRFFIRQCLDGFFMQKTDFKFEVVIHDDASTDGTTEIIKEYEARHPEIIRPIYQTENQFSKGIKPTWVFNAPRWKGKYVAFCEGDDYWIDPLKLQKQVAFLEANRQFSAVSCYNMTINVADGQISSPQLSDKIISFCFDDYVQVGTPGLRTLNMVYRADEKFRALIANKQYSSSRANGDIVLVGIVLKYLGDIAVLPFLGATYRKHPGGINSGLQSRFERRKSVSRNYLSLVSDILDNRNDRIAFWKKNLKSTWKHDLFFFQWQNFVKDLKSVFKS